MSSDFVCWLCLWSNAETITCQRDLKKKSISPLPFQKKKIFCPEKWALALKASCFLPNKAMDRKLVPFERVVLTLQNETNPGPVAQFVRMHCSFKVHGACQWKWDTRGYGWSPFNNPLTQSGKGKDAKKWCLGTNHRFCQPIGWPTSLLVHQKRTNRGKFAVQENIFEQFNFKHRTLRNYAFMRLSDAFFFQLSLSTNGNSFTLIQNH